MDNKPVFITGKFVIDEIKPVFYPVKLAIYDNKFGPLDMKHEIQFPLFRNSSANQKPAFSFAKRPLSLQTKSRLTGMDFFLSETVLIVQILPANLIFIPKIENPLSVMF